MRLAVLVALTLALAACGGQEETTQPETTQPEATPATTAATTTARATTAPTTTTPGASAVAGTTLDGEPISLDDFRGKPVFVNVWSSW